MDYQLLAELEKARKTEIKREQRAGVIDKLLIDANKDADKIDVQGAPLQEVMPAK
jgi:hypothetical protein